MKTSAHLFPYAVYATLAATRFEQARLAGSLTFGEGKRWTGATQILDEAHGRNQRVASSSLTERMAARTSSAGPSSIESSRRVPERGSGRVRCSGCTQHRMESASPFSPK